MSLADVLVTLGAVAAGIGFYLAVQKLRSVPLRTWWRLGGGFLNALRYIGYGIGGVWMILCIAWGIGILLWFALVVGLAAWIVQHWRIGLPALAALFLAGRAILIWAAKVRCDICKHSIGNDSDAWTIVNLRTKRPNEALRFVHKDCMAEDAGQ